MNRPFPSCPSLCFKARLSAYLYEMIFNCLAKKTYFHKKGFARSKPHFESENFWNLATAYKRVSMGLTDRRKTAKNLVDSRKN